MRGNALASFLVNALTGALVLEGRPRRLRQCQQGFLSIHLVVYVVPLLVNATGRKAD